MCERKAKYIDYEGERKRKKINISCNTWVQSSGKGANEFVVKRNVDCFIEAPYIRHN